MCRSATLALLFVVTAATVFGQAGVLDWRHVGNSALELNLPGPATGPVDRVWFSADGARLYARTSSGRVYETKDFENWVGSQDTAPAAPETTAPKMPEDAATVKVAVTRRDRLYAAGQNAWRSDDGGQHWTNLTEWAEDSILGGRLSDTAVSPVNPDEVVVAGATGVWRSLDGGMTWTGVNDGLPAMPIERILATPSGTQPLRIAVARAEAEWRAAKDIGWTVLRPDVTAREAARRRELSDTLGAEITAVAQVGDTVYAGSSDGRIWATSNAGRSWRTFPVPDRPSVAAIYVDTRDPMFAVAAVNSNGRGRVLRTANGGVYWDDLSAQTALAVVRGVTADKDSGAIYAATAKGVWMTYGDGSWTNLSSGLPDVPAVDVKLNQGGHQLYAALDGYGVFAAVAPHRTRQPKLVSAGDLEPRAAAPGALMTVIGRKIDSATANDQPVPVLAQSQIQIPFNATGPRVAIALESVAGPSTHSLPLQNTSPAIFVDADGNPLITDADSGLLLNAGTPVRPATRLQIFATGLGRVTPEWPAGVAAPLQNAPAIVAPVRVLLDRQPLEVTRATLAPGYIGFYLIEVELPSILNAGTAELYLEVDGQPSNRVKLYIEP